VCVVLLVCIKVLLEEVISAHYQYYHQQFTVRVKAIGSNTSNSECRYFIIKDLKIVQLIQQILSEKENPYRDRTVTGHHTSLFFGVNRG
jgi:hypothetical protein